MAMSGLVPAPNISSNRPVTATSAARIPAPRSLAPPGPLPRLSHLRGRLCDRLPSLSQMVEVLAHPEHVGAVVRWRVASAGHAVGVVRTLRGGQYLIRRCVAGRSDLRGETIVEAGEVRGLPAERGQVRVSVRAHLLMAPVAVG